MNVNVSMTVNDVVSLAEGSESGGELEENVIFWAKVSGRGGSGSARVSESEICMIQGKSATLMW